MRHSRRRPLGVTVIAVLVAIKGIASVAMGTDLVNLDLSRSTHVDEPAAAFSLAIGLLFLYKAYGLWNLHSRVWRIMVLLVALDGTVAAWQLNLGTGTVTAGISLAVAVCLELYLLRPSVRERFFEEHDET